jgi:prepilin-type N-terminal cleavage/methylation domain-containing protein
MKNKNSQNNKKYQTAFSMIEILIAIAILLIIGSVSVASFINWRREKKIDSASDITLSVLEEARAQTINAYQGKQYGVYFGVNDRLISFVGNVYNSSDISNKITMLPEGEIISTSTMGESIIFQKFSGSAGAGGNIVLKDHNNTSTTRTILIDNSGVISVKK